MLDQTDHQKNVEEEKLYQSLIAFIEVDDNFKDIATVAPEFYSYLKKYQNIIKKKLTVTSWVPKENNFNCDDAVSIKEVTLKKQELFE